jgi:hypothetical protein
MGTNSFELRGDQGNEAYFIFILPIQLPEGLMVVRRGLEPPVPGVDSLGSPALEPPALEVDSLGPPALEPSALEARSVAGPLGLAQLGLEPVPALASLGSVPLGARSVL